jgi:hypothetical protein
MITEYPAGQTLGEVLLRCLHPAADMQFVLQAVKAFPTTFSDLNWYAVMPLKIPCD